MRRQPFDKIWKKGEAIVSGFNGWIHGNDRESNPGTRSSSPGSIPQITIRELMSPDPVTTRLEAPLHQALGLLLRKNLSAVPVLDEKGVIVGLLNERHLLQALGDPDATTVSAIMDRDPVTIAVDAPVIEVVDRLMLINVRQVFVLEESTLVGIVTRADLMPAILDILRQRESMLQAAPTLLH